jgi:DNA polymerase III delta prime subunit
MREDFLWSQKYRPKTVSETILPADLKASFQHYVDQQNVPNLILAGGAGMGKTTVARAMLDELDCDYIILNGSLNVNIDALRKDITSFASTVSFKGKRKYIILDEADYLTGHIVQPALRSFIEDFSANCGFILTCNLLNRIIEPLRSRCVPIEFKIAKDDQPRLASQFFKRIINILEVEGVAYDKAVVGALVSRYMPDWRRVLNELQRYSVNGKVDTGILTDLTGDNFKNLVGLLKKKDFLSLRKWVAETDFSIDEVFTNLYDKAYDYVNPKYIPQLILIMADYQYKAAFAANAEINLAAALTQIMVDIEFV